MLSRRCSLAVYYSLNIQENWRIYVIVILGSCIEILVSLTVDASPSTVTVCFLALSLDA